MVAQPTVREQFEKINTVADAEKYVTANASLKPAILRLSYGKDTAIIDKRLLKRKHPTGDIDPNYSGSGSSERVVVIQ